MNSNQRDISNFKLQNKAVTLSSFMSRVYAWMTAGMLITGGVAYYVGHTPELINQIFANRIFFYALIIVQLGAVIFLSAAINRISAATAAITYLMYSALTGLTFSSIFILYAQQDIMLAFAVTAGSFAGLSLFGYATKRDLGPIGSFCMMGLFGVIIISLLSFFFPSLMSEQAQLIISVCGVIIFAGLTAYDTQNIKQMALAGGGSEQYAILGALRLYLDFINLFLFILRLMGGRR